MALTTLSGLASNATQPQNFCRASTGTLVAGQPRSLMYLSGYPTGWVAPTPGITGAALTSYPGQIPVPGPITGKNIYLSRFSGQSSAQGGTLLLCDRLWHNSGLSVTATTAQTIGSVAWPARDADGSTNGRQVYLGLEVTTATSTGTPTITVSYTDSAGTAGNTGTNIVATTASAGIGSFFPIGLANGDVGVQSVQSLTLSATWTSGAVSLVAYRVLAALELRSPLTPNALDAVNMGMPQLYDNSVPFFIYIPLATTATQIAASVVFAQG